MKGHDLEPEGVESLDHAELVGLVRMLTERGQALEAENERLRSENEGLHREAGRDSTNSGLPPAGDDKAAREKRAKTRRKPIRVKGKRKPGKQPGGEGHTLSRVCDPDRTILLGACEPTLRSRRRWLSSPTASSPGSRAQSTRTAYVL